MQRLRSSIPDMQKTLETVKFLESKQVQSQVVMERSKRIGDGMGWGWGQGQGDRGQGLEMMTEGRILGRKLRRDSNLMIRFLRLLRLLLVMKYFSGLV
jgi:hypothetical protein